MGELVHIQGWHSAQNIEMLSVIFSVDGSWSMHIPSPGPALLLTAKKLCPLDFCISNDREGEERIVRPGRERDIDVCWLISQGAQDIQKGGEEAASVRNPHY